MKKLIAILIAVVMTFSTASVACALETPSANLVDERFELIALIFRLSGHEAYDIQFTDYHKDVAARFEQYKDHPAVKYASTLDISPSDVFAYAMHMKEDMSGLVDDIGSIVGPLGDRWTDTTANTFWPLVRQFYMDTDFAAFYQSKTPFFLAESELFTKSDRLSSLDLDWLVPFAEWFEVPTEYRYIVSPSIYYANLAARERGKTNYSVLSTDLDETFLIDGMLIHEFCHSFGDSAGIMWYMENEDHRKFCEATSTSYYDDELTVSCEYMVRAYTILYFADHGDEWAVSRLLQEDAQLGFTYIEDVYRMLRAYEKRD